jgi:hypothetical protein
MSDDPRGQALENLRWRAEWLFERYELMLPDLKEFMTEQARQHVAKRVAELKGALEDFDTPIEEVQRRFEVLDSNLFVLRNAIITDNLGKRLD